MCNESNKEIVGIRYYAAYETGETLKEINLSEDAFAQPTEFDILPLVYFRLAKPLKAGSTLPLIDLSKLYTPNTDFKFELQLNAERRYFSNKQMVIDIIRQLETNVLFRKQYMALLQKMPNPTLQ